MPKNRLIQLIGLLKCGTGVCGCRLELFSACWFDQRRRMMLSHSKVDSRTADNVARFSMMLVYTNGGGCVL